MTTAWVFAIASNAAVDGPGTVSAKTEASVPIFCGKYRDRKSSGRQMIFAPFCAASPTFVTAFLRFSSGSVPTVIWMSPIVTMLCSTSLVLYNFCFRRYSDIRINSAGIHWTDSSKEMQGKLVFAIRTPRRDTKNSAGSFTKSNFSGRINKNRLEPGISGTTTYNPWLFFPLHPCL